MGELESFLASKCNFFLSYLHKRKLQFWDIPGQTKMVVMQIIFHSVKYFAKINASRFKCIISENDQTPSPPHKLVYLFAVERDGLEYIILCSNFFSMAWYLPLSIVNHYHMFSHFLYYSVYFTMSTGYQKLPKDKRFCYCKCTFISFSLCMLSNFKLLHHHLIFMSFFPVLK